MANKSNKGGTVLPKGEGRKKGSKNKFTELKDAFLQAFVGIGGAEELQKWGKIKANRRDFYMMITKLLPKDIKMGPDEDAQDALKDILDAVKGVTRGLPNRTQGKVRE